ncbi:MAG: LysR family transcriptional regulator [Cellvibrionaceae bacterium]|nr:LysR family transcriptional regulator [Cellvibrionaceae bacterium]|tara:strand:- start:4084 stop:4959 length:876 start_codon:yes stop_codon:yes gene_type:complete
MINPQWLRTYCTLVEVGHFTQTAEKLYMTQSGVSQQIRKLESHFGAPLLIREGKQFSLTDAGSRLYREGRQLLNAMTELEQNVSSDPTHAGLVRIASPGSVGLKLYSQLLQFQVQHPELVIDFRFAPNADVASLLVEHKIDLGFMTDVSNSVDLSVEPIAEEPLQLITPAAITDVRWESLSQLGFVDHPDGFHHAQRLLSKNYPEFQHASQFEAAGFSNQIHLILEPVSLGLGFTVLPSYAVEAFPKPESIRVHRLGNPVKETVFMGRYRHKPLSNRVATVAEVAKSFLAQ